VARLLFYEAYREYVDDVTCVDWPNSLHGVSFVDFECDLTAPLPFRSGEFNTIILSDVLEHIPTPDALVSEMSRILAGGGKCLLNVPFYYWLHEAPHDYYRYTEHALRRFAALHRFEVLVLEPYGGAPEILADVLAKLFNRVPLVGPPTAIIIQALARLALATRVGRQISRNTAKRFPWGYFMIIKKSSVTDSSDE